MKGFVLAVVVALVAASGAAAKPAKFVSRSESRLYGSRTGEWARVVIRASEAQDSGCRLRLVAVAPGVDRYRALDAFVIGGDTVSGPTGPSFHRLRPIPRLGFLAPTKRSGPYGVAGEDQVPPLGSMANSPSRTGAQRATQHARPRYGPSRFAKRYEPTDGSSPVGRRTPARRLGAGDRHRAGSGIVAVCLDRPEAGCRKRRRLRPRAGRIGR